MFRWIITLLVCIVVSSCNNVLKEGFEYEYILESEFVGDLTKGSKIFFDDVHIGNITHVEHNSPKEIYMSLNNDSIIRQDGQYLIYYNLNGRQDLEIIPNFESEKLKTDNRLLITIENKHYNSN